jgi:hypothetical protein
VCDTGNKLPKFTQPRRGLEIVDKPSKSRPRRPTRPKNLGTMGTENDAFSDGFADERVSIGTERIPLGRRKRISLAKEAVSQKPSDRMISPTLLGTRTPCFSSLAMVDAPLASRQADSLPRGLEAGRLSEDYLNIGTQLAGNHVGWIPK